jgi:hypothetical protein
MNLPRYALVFFGLMASQLAGESLFSLRCGTLNWAERRGWSGAIGLAILGGVFFLACWLHLAPTPPLLLGTLIGIAGAAFCLRRHGRDRAEPFGQAGPGTRFLELLIPLGVILYAIRALAQPMYGYDYLIDWGLKGKTMFALAKMPAFLLHSGAVTPSHPEYPLLLPLEMASLARIMGVWDDQLLALLFVGFQLFTILILWGYLARRVGRGEAAVGAALLALCAPLYSRLLTGYAEIPLALAALMTVTAFRDAGENRGGSGIYARLSVATAILCAIKLEGFIWVGVLALYQLGPLVWHRERPRLRLLAALVGPPALLLALRVPFGQTLRLPEATASVAGVLHTADAGRLVEVLKETWTLLIAPRSVVIGAVVLTFLATRRRRETDFALLYLGVFLPLVDIVVPWTSLPSVFSWVQHGSERYTLATIPVFLISLAGRFSALFDRPAAVASGFGQDPRASAPNHARYAPANPGS